MNKIVSINCVYGIGSTGRMIDQIEHSLKKKYLFFQIAEYGDKIKPKNVHYVAEGLLLHVHFFLARTTGLYFFWGFLSTRTALKILCRIRPDIIHIHCPNSGNIRITDLLNYAAKYNVPVIITNHCETFYTGSCFHAYDCKRYEFGCGMCPRKGNKFDLTALEWKGLKKAYKNIRNLIMVAVSPWQVPRIEASGLFYKVNTWMIPNGIDTKIFFCRLQRRNDINTKIVLHVTSKFSIAEDDPKGGNYIVEIAKLNPDMVFVVVGNINGNIPKVSNLKLKGRVEDSVELAKYYCMADITLLASKRETFGLVCAESLCCGTPVIGFQCGGTESIGDKRYSEFCRYGDIRALDGLLKKWIDFKQNSPDFSVEMADKYGADKMIREYDRLYREVLERKCK